MRGALCADGLMRHGCTSVDRRPLDRFEDLVVARAAAQVAGERLLDLLAGRLREFLQQVGRRHQDAGRAVAALHRARVDEGLLEGMQALSARRSRRGRGEASPSTVTTSQPSARSAGTRQLITATPSSQTVQAPHSPSAQPSFVPVSPASSRSARSSVLPRTLCRTVGLPLSVRCTVSDEWRNGRAAEWLISPFARFCHSRRSPSPTAAPAAPANPRAPCRRATGAARARSARAPCRGGNRRCRGCPRSGGRRLPPARPRCSITSSVSSLPAR